MVRKFIYILVLFSRSIFSNQELDFKCSEINSSLNTSQIHCLQLDGINVDKDDFANLTSINEPLQEWLWVKDKAHKTIEDDKEKMLFLKEIEKSFVSANNGFKNASDIDVKRVFEYNAKFEELLDLVNQESFLSHALNVTCPRIRCHDDKRDDFRVRIASVQAKKIAILMSYPLLANESVRDLLEDESENYVKYADKGGEVSLAEFKKNQIANTRKEFPTVMLKGIKKTEDALKERITDWEKFNTENTSNTQNELRFQNGSREKGLLERSFSSYESSSDSIQRDNPEILNEIISNVNLEKEMSNPYIGKAVCNINHRNKDQLDIVRRNQMVVDTTLFVAPFFLGPIGAGIRLLNVGKIAAWGVRSDLAVAAVLETSLLSKDISDLGDLSKKCNNLQLQTLKLSDDRSIGKNDEVNIEEISNCQDSLETQTMMSMGGALLGGASFLRMAKNGTPKSFSNEAKSILEKFRKSKSQRDLENFLKNDNISSSDMKLLSKEFEEFKILNKFKNDDEAISAFKIEYNKKYANNSAPSCSI